MGTSHTIDAATASSSSRGQISLTVLLLVVGLLGHLFAAHAMGGYRIAYSHHVFGFFFILAVTGTVIAGLGRFLWRGRHGLTLLVIGATQAILGLLVAYNQQAHH